MKTTNYFFVILAILSVVLISCNQAQTSNIADNNKLAQAQISTAEKCSSLEEKEKSGATEWTLEEKELMEKCEAAEKEKSEQDELVEEGSKEPMMAEEGFEMTGGKMMMVNEKTKTQVAMEKEYVLEDGTRVSKDGKVTRKDGTEFMLKEGESVWMDGTFAKAGEMMEDNEMTEKDEKSMMSDFKGKVLAGKTSPYIDFNKADYDKALKENKKIMLYFYASWCPLCKAEEPKTFAAFNELNDPNLVGFKVNYRDSETDADEEALAEEFGVAYQHTKVTIKDGKKAGKFPDSWDKQRYLEELGKL